MWFLRLATSVLILWAAAFAAELRILVIDPQSAPVAGAQVTLIERGSHKVAAVENTSVEGLVAFAMAGAGPYQIKVLAPGFGEQTVPSEIATEDQEASSLHHRTITIRLRLAPATETVVVTATRSPLPDEAANGSVATLNGAQLQTMQPIAADDALRFLPGAILGTQGQRGGLSSLFVRGGDSRYNKVIVDGVPINEPGGTFDFGLLPLGEADRFEFMRGAQSTLYGSDAMTSVVQFWTRAGNSQTPELRLGADGGNFATAHGYISLAGARGGLDYNLFADQFNTGGRGPNDDYGNSLAGGNLGIALTKSVGLRLRTRHSVSHTGVQGEWNFNGAPLMSPDRDQRAGSNVFLSSAELGIAGPSRWQHRITGFEYRLRRKNGDRVVDPNRVSPFGNVDTPFHAITDINRAGFDYQGDYPERSWAQTTVGYEFEDENGAVGDLPDSVSHGLRRNHALYGQQIFMLGRGSLVAGARFVHNESFGNRLVPRVALGITALRGGQVFTGTRLRFSYATGIKEPSFSESFGNGGGFPTAPNPALKPEQTRAFEAGVEQKFRQNYSFSAIYFNSLFRDKIDFNLLSCNPFCGQFVNVDKALAHGAELELNLRPLARLSAGAIYTYTSTQILEQPFAFDPLLEPGQPLIRRPRHSGNLLLTYVANRWGASLGGSFIGRRADSDFFGFGINHAAGYARVDVGGWYALSSRISAYANLGNALNRQYQEVVGYPALSANFRAGVRFRIGGD
jgi:vitamin B12 transporter